MPGEIVSNIFPCKSLHCKLDPVQYREYEYGLLTIECVHDGHVGGPKQYNDFPLENICYFYANIFYCFSPPTWPPCTHSIGSCVSVRSSRYEARGKFGEHERCVRVARGLAEGNSSFLSALQTSQVGTLNSH